MSNYKNLLIGTCSWNYNSWNGLIYSSAAAKAVDYLPEYAKKYRTVEIDSWFYKYPAMFSPRRSTCLIFMNSIRKSADY